MNDNFQDLFNQMIHLTVSPLKKRQVQYIYPPFKIDLYVWNQHAKSWINFILFKWSIWMHANADFVMQSGKQQSFPLFWHKFHSKVVSGCSNYFASLPHQISSCSTEQCARKWSQKVLFSTDLVTLDQGQSHWKWFENGTYYSTADLKECVWKVCIQCPMLKFLPCQPDQWVNTTDYIDPNATHMDKNN